MKSRGGKAKALPRGGWVWWVSSGSYLCVCVFFQTGSHYVAKISNLQFFYLHLLSAGITVMQHLLQPSYWYWTGLLFPESSCPGKADDWRHWTSS
jgi:hypothetical protein